MVRKTKILLFPAIVILICLSTMGCGGNNAASVTLDKGQTENVLTNRDTLGTTDLLVTDPPQAELPPLTLAGKVQVINSAFSTSNALFDPSTADPGGSYHVPNRLIIHFVNDLTVAGINTDRAAWATSSNGLSSGTVVVPPEMTTVVPTPIDPLLAEALPAVSETQAAGRMVMNDEYITLARFIGGTYNLDLVTEVYYGAANWVVCTCDPAVDMQSLAVQIQQENNDFVYMVEPDYVMFPGEYWPRPMDSELDDFGQVGSGIADNTNGHDFWDYNAESYHYFQSGMYRTHASAMGYGLDLDPITNETWVSPGWGASVFVADSGVVPGHNELMGNIVMPPDPQGLNLAYWDTSGDGTTTFVDYLENDPEHPLHGTKSCGIVGARQRNGGTVGMIPCGTVYPFKIAGDSLPPGYKNGTASTVALAMQRAFDCRLLTDCYVFSLSWGTRQVNRPVVFDTALANISTDEKFVIVACAHNQNEYVRDFTSGMWPAAMADDSMYPEHVISVMAVNIDDDKSSFSNYEHPLWPNTVTVSAPGGDVVGFNSYGSLTVGAEPDSYAVYNGTSMATPIVAGLVGMLQSYKQMTASQIKAHIVNTGRTEKWDGTPIGANTKPIIDCDAAMSWGNLRLPSTDLGVIGDPPVITGPTTFVVDFFPAGGWVGDNTCTLTAEFVALVTDPGMSALLGTVPFGPINSEGICSASFEFDPAKSLGTHGQVFFWVIITADPGGGEKPRMLNTWALETEVMYEWETWDKVPLADIWSLRGLAIGHDTSDILHIGYANRDQIIGEPEDVILLRENGEGSRVFDIILTDPLDTNPPYLTIPIDMSIGQSNTVDGLKTGVLYQRGAMYNPPTSAYRTGFGYEESGNGQYEVDDLSEPYINGRNNTSLRANMFSPEWYSLMYNWSTDHFFLSIRNAFGIWSTSDVGDPGIPDADITTVALVPYNNTYSGVLRSAVSRVYNYTPPTTFNVTYGIPNYPGGMVEIIVPKANPSATGDKWVGTALLGYSEAPFGGPWNVDAEFSPVVFIRSYEELADVTGYLDAAVANGGGGFDTYTVEECPSGPEYPDNYPYMTGNAGQALLLNTPTRQQVAIVYISGNQVKLDDSDVCDLKIAYHDYNDDWSTPWDVYTVDPFPSQQYVKADVVNDKVVILYVRHEPNGTGGLNSELRLAYEPDL